MIIAALKAAVRRNSFLWSHPHPIRALLSTHHRTNMVAPKQFTDYVDAHVPQFIDRLAEAVAIPRCARLDNLKRIAAG